MRLSEISFRPGDRVLFIAIRAMGDTLLATPLIRDFKSKFPTAHIELIAESLPEQVLQGNHNISKLLTSPNRGSWIGEYRRLYLYLLKTKYKVSIDLISTPGSALISFIANAQTRIGYRLKGRTWAYNAPAMRQSNDNYSALTKYDLIDSMDISCSSPLPEIFPESQYVSWADKRFQDLNIDIGKPIIGISPWSKREWRRWNMDN